jgi:hypothetical protein
LNGLHALTDSCAILDTFPGRRYFKFLGKNLVDVISTITIKPKPTKMPHSESTNATFSTIWLMAMGIVICGALKSPWGFVFLFGLLWCSASVIKQFTSSSNDGESLASNDNNDTEMQPLGKIRGDMTLGEILAKY